MDSSLSSKSNDVNNLLKDSILSAIDSTIPNDNQDNNNNTASLDFGFLNANVSSSMDMETKPALEKIWLYLTKEEKRVKRRDEREARIKQRELELKGKISPKKNSAYSDLINEINDKKHKEWYMKAFDNQWTIPMVKVITSGIKLEQGTVVYKVLVKEISGKEWYIYRRYSDFLNVATYLENLDDKEFAPAPAHNIPPKDWNLKNRVLFPLNEKRLEERRLGLEAWLQGDNHYYNHYHYHNNYY